MAYVKKSGKRYQVRQGNTNKLLRSFSSKQDAEVEVLKLHNKFKPKKKNRGKIAASRYAA